MQLSYSSPGMEITSHSDPSASVIKLLPLFNDPLAARASLNRH